VGADDGRTPTADDLILPLPPPHQARRHVGQRDDQHRDSDYSYKRWCRDLKALGLRHRRAHDARATFITLALDDGADAHVIERLTHPSTSRRAFDLGSSSKKGAGRAPGEESLPSKMKERPCPIRSLS